ncbi:MAG: hypothetical protein ACP5HS_04910 [Anaerolineae bacterium]
MNSLSQMQKIILIVLAVLDVVVIGGMALVVVTSSRAPARAAGTPMPDAGAPNTAVPTWTPTPTHTPKPTLPARLTNTPTPTSTPYPTATPTSTPTRVPAKPVTLEGAEFDYVLPNRIPGWDWDAYVNYRPGDEYVPETSYAEPVFTAADDPARRINGSTLKVETIRWLKFRTWVHQTVTLTAGSEVYFQIKAKAFSSLDSLIVKAGIDPTGAENCYGARWGDEIRVNQDSGTVTLTSPRVTVRAAGSSTEETDEAEEANEPAIGSVTLCFFAEPVYPHVNNAAFFDQAQLVVKPPR